VRGCLWEQSSTEEVRRYAYLLYLDVASGDHHTVLDVVLLLELHIQLRSDALMMNYLLDNILKHKRKDSPATHNHPPLQVFSEPFLSLSSSDNTPPAVGQHTSPLSTSCPLPKRNSLGNSSFLLILPPSPTFSSLDFTALQELAWACPR